MLRHSLAFYFSKNYIKWLRCVQSIDDARKKWRGHGLVWRVISMDDVFPPLSESSGVVEEWVPLLGESNDAYLLRFSSLDRVFNSSNQTKHPNCRYAVRVPFRTTCHVHFGMKCCLVPRAGRWLWQGTDTTGIPPLICGRPRKNRGFTLLPLIFELSPVAGSDRVYVRNISAKFEGERRIIAWKREVLVTVFFAWTEECRVAGCLNLKCDKMVRALFFRAHKACRCRSEPQSLVDFSPLLPSALSTGIFLSYIFCYLPSGYMLAGLLLLRSTTSMRWSWLSGVIKVPWAVWLYVCQDIMDLNDIFPNLDLSRDEVKTWIYDDDLKAGYTGTRLITILVVVQDD